MPVVNAEQARIELSAKQVLAFIDHMHALFAKPGEQLPPMIYIEETNLTNTVVVGGRGMNMTLIHHDGEIRELTFRSGEA